MTLDYIYHSGFAIEAEGVTVIIDYYKDSSETEHNRGIVHDYLLQRPGKLYVLATHFHPDHFNREILTWKEVRPDIRYIFSNAPWINVSGVRNSCDILVKKRSFDWFSSSICFFSFFSYSSEALNFNLEE